MGATGALRFARLATEAVVALVPQVDLRDFEYAGRADFTPERKARRVSAIPNLDPNPNPHPNPNPNPNPNQDAAQQYGPSLLRPLRPGTLVLDACAAPGGKLRALLRHQPLVRSLGGGLGLGLWCACSRWTRA